MGSLLKATSDNRLKGKSHFFEMKLALILAILAVSTYAEPARQAEESAPEEQSGTDYQGYGFGFGRGGYGFGGFGNVGYGNEGYGPGRYGYGRRPVPYKYKGSIVDNNGNRLKICCWPCQGGWGQICCDACPGS